MERAPAPKRGSQPERNRMFLEFDLSHIPLKENHAELPLWVGDLRQKFYSKVVSGVEKRTDEFEYVVNLFLESFSPKYKQTYDFVISIAEPKSRQEFIHYYEINPSSLNAAITLGLSADEIIEQLKKFNKMVHIPDGVDGYIRKTTSSFGKAKLVLKENRYFIESEDSGVIQFYKAQRNLEDCWLQESVHHIRSANIEEEEINILRKGGEDFASTRDTEGGKTEGAFDKLLHIKNQEDFVEKYEMMIQEAEKEEDNGPIRTIYRLEIHPQMIDKVKKERTLMSNEDKFKYMLTQEFDFKRETVQNPLLDFRLKTQVKIRPYQEKALSRMFVEGRARSGVIVLPCGAGKTLVGIVAMSRIKRRTLILCINNLTVNQWEKQILDFSTMPQSKIHKFVSGAGDRQVPNLNESCVVISTYTMISRSDEGRSAFSSEFIEKLGQVEWGLLLLDEVQVAPAEVFKKAFLTKTKSHCKLGLTATLVREDNKIEDLQFYIGPKLYEESWKDLTNQGFLARVQCVEIRTSMTDAFMKMYTDKQDISKNIRMYLYSGNPNKFFVIQHLIKMHVAHGDKILVFIDSIDILIKFAKILGYPFIYGQMKNYEREKLLKFFQELPNWNVLFVSRVGDVGIDLPDANVAIEVSSQFGSRRQEAQRLGRILRPKENKEGKYQSYFYSLVSIGTDEVKYAIKRQKFLVKQGYSFKIIKEEVLPYNRNPRDKRKMKMSKLEDQLKFLEDLTSLSLQNESNRQSKNEEDDFEEKAPVVRRTQMNTQQGNLYAERTNY